MPLDCVIFDLGNVLIKWDRRFLFEKLIPDPGELDHFLDEILTLDANAGLDRGVPLTEVTAALAETHPGHRELIEAFRDRWLETLGETISGSVELLDELATTTSLRLYALSNWGRDTFALAEPNLAFLERFDGVVISGREGVVKPDPEIFLILCERHGVVPEQAVFIDDSPTNIDAAARLGFQTVLFKSPTQCRGELRSFGLDLAELTS